jgi:succinate dehydrogenase / fumarate reductase cytochrome b subunit
LKRLGDALASSIGKKFVMGITGLLLCGFLVGHLTGNLLIYVGAEKYNDYAHMLHSQKLLLPVVEIGLLLLFLAHLYLAFRTSRENRAARNQQYAVKASKIESAGANKLQRSDTWMLVSGIVVLLFVLLHLVDMRFELRPDVNYGTLTPFEKTVLILETPLTFWVYIIGCVFLGFHLSHGFASAFQSLGLSHPRFNSAIRCISLVFALVIALGFASFPVWFNFQ